MSFLRKIVMQGDPIYHKHNCIYILAGVCQSSITKTFISLSLHVNKTIFSLKKGQIHCYILFSCLTRLRTNGYAEYHWKQTN